MEKVNPMNKPSPMEFSYMECGCHSESHIIRGMYDPDDNFLYLSYHLPRQPFWRRLRIAVKYLFGIDSKYGAWDCHSIDSPEKRDQWIKMLQQIKDDHRYPSSPLKL